MSQLDLMTDFQSQVPPQYRLPQPTDLPVGGYASPSTGGGGVCPQEYHSSSTEGAGWILLLAVGAQLVLGYVLVQLLAPEANELLGYFTFGLFGMALLFISILALALLVWGITAAFNVARRVLGRGLIRLGTWMTSSGPN